MNSLNTYVSWLAYIQANLDPTDFDDFLKIIMDARSVQEFASMCWTYKKYVDNHLEVK